MGKQGVTWLIPSHARWYIRSAVARLCAPACTQICRGLFHVYPSLASYWLIMLRHGVSEKRGMASRLSDHLGGGFINSLLSKVLLFWIGMGFFSARQLVIVAFPITPGLQDRYGGLGQYIKGSLYLRSHVARKGTCPVSSSRGQKMTEFRFCCTAPCVCRPGYRQYIHIG